MDTCEVDKEIVDIHIRETNIGGYIEGRQTK